MSETDRVRDALMIRVDREEIEQLRNLVLWSHDPNADYIYDKLSAWLGEQG